MNEDELLEHEIDTKNATAAGVAELLAQTAKGMRDIHDDNSRRFALSLSITELEDRE